MSVSQCKDWIFGTCFDQPCKDLRSLGSGAFHRDDMDGLGLGRHALVSSGNTCTDRVIEIRMSEDDDLFVSIH